MGAGNSSPQSRTAGSEASSDARLGVLYQVDHTWLRLEPVGGGSDLRVRTVSRESPRSVRGICTTLGCGGKLMPATAAGDDDHYRYLYRNLNPVPLKRGSTLHS